jgi:hypothetical protein
MIVRLNPCYRPNFQRDRRGWLIITRRFIFATGTFARNAAVGNIGDYDEPLVAPPALAPDFIEPS